MIGAQPFEAVYHQAQLSLLNNLLHSSNQGLLDLCLRQTAMKRFYSKSWFTHINKVLDIYNLPSLSRLLDETPTKAEFKTSYKKAINKVWNKKLLDTCTTKKSLAYANLEICSSGKPHPVWQTVQNNVHDVRRAAVKAKVISGTLLLQDKLHKYNLANLPECKLCHVDCEDLAHFLLYCPVLYKARGKYLDKIRQLIICGSSADTWHTICSQEEILLQTFIDCTSVPELINCDLKDIERYTRYIIVLRSIKLERYC
jgi:hypothetical protein